MNPKLVKRRMKLYYEYQETESKISKMDKEIENLDKQIYKSLCKEKGISQRRKDSSVYIIAGDYRITLPLRKSRPRNLKFKRIKKK